MPRTRFKIRILFDCRVSEKILGGPSDDDNDNGSGLLIASLIVFQESISLLGFVSRKDEKIAVKVENTTKFAII